MRLKNYYPAIDAHGGGGEGGRGLTLDSPGKFQKTC
jgi:hypothetical protein